MLLLYSAVVTVCVCVRSVVSQPVSGCPSYGCTPTGSFSLLTPSGIPRSGVKVVWTAQLSNASGTGSRLLGCVSNDRHVVCPSQNGYVGVDGDTGKVLWRDSSLVNPSLPIMDISGDIIGSDGRYLTKVDGDGTVEKPVIPLDPPMTPVFSLEFGDGNILLIVSQTGEVVAYLANGIPLASLVLRGNVEMYNGTFHPIAQPIMRGSRAYILTQFQPDPQDAAIPQEKIVRMQRLYSVDIRVSELERMRVVWSVNVGTGRATFASDDDSDDTDGGSENVLLYYHSTIYISLSAVDGRGGDCDAVSTLLAVREDGSKGTIVHTSSYPPSYFAVYDDVTFCHDNNVQMPVVWVAQQRGSVISALNPKTKSMFMNITLNALLNVKHVRLTSSLMVHIDTADRFVLMFSLSIANTTALMYSQHLVTLQGVLSSHKAPTVMWNTALPDSFQVEGQISFVSASYETFVGTGRNMTGVYAFGLR